jgi:hypothetical protein
MGTNGEAGQGWKGKVHRGVKLVGFDDVRVDALRGGLIVCSGVKHLEELENYAQIPPAINQIEVRRLTRIQSLATGSGCQIY